MTRAIKLMLLFARVSTQNFAAYRFDFLVRLTLSVLHLGTELVIVWTIFENTDTLAGWHWQHLLVLVGVYRIVAGGIRMSIVPNMRRVLEDIREGTLDFVLLRPVNAQLLVSIREFVIWRTVDVVLGLATAVAGCLLLPEGAPSATGGTILAFVVMLAAGFAIVYSIWLMLATLCFWFVRIQNIEMIFWNVFEAGRFPIVIYRPSVQWFLTFIIPLAFITTFPASAMFGDASLLPGWVPLGWMAPIAVALAVVLLLISGWFWRFGLRHYSGASA